MPHYERRSPSLPSHHPWQNASSIPIRYLPASPKQSTIVIELSDNPTKLA